MYGFLYKLGMDSEQQSREQGEGAGNSRGYHAYKIAEHRWGIVYRLDARTSFDQRVIYPTKRRAVAIAALLNREEC